MKKIAVIRGANLNRFELQNYEQLSQDFDITCVGSTQSSFETDNIHLKTIKLPSLYSKFKRIPILRDYIKGPLLGKHYLLGLEKIFKENDIIHVSGVSRYSAQVVKLKEKYPEKKIVATWWSNIAFNNERINKIKYKYYIQNGIDQFIAMSEGAKQILLFEGIKEEKISKIMYGVDVNRFKPGGKNIELMRSLGISKDDFVILFPARLELEKGIFEALSSFKKLLDTSKNNKLKLLYIGSGPDMNNLKKTIDRHNLQNNVIIKNTLSYNQMPDIHNLADIYMLLSMPSGYWIEQLGVALIESMASGKSIIATLSGAIPEVLGDCGILVPPRDFHATYKALEKLYNDPDLRASLGNKARKRAETVFNTQNVSKKIKEVYDKLL